jgi:hypothetical protein
MAIWAGWRWWPSCVEVLNRIAIVMSLSRRKVSKSSKVDAVERMLSGSNIRELLSLESVYNVTRIAASESITNVRSCGLRVDMMVLQRIHHFFLSITTTQHFHSIFLCESIEKSPGAPIHRARPYSIKIVRNGGDLRSQRSNNLIDSNENGCRGRIRDDRAS